MISIEIFSDVINFLVNRYIKMQIYKVIFIFFLKIINY